MREPVASKEIKIVPEYFDKTYFHWIDNLKDWCISRQIWYGHRIPVWYRSKAGILDGGSFGMHAFESGLAEMYCGIEPPEGKINERGDYFDTESWTQDEDTLDTWFSSALWTFSTLGWPEQTEDLKIYHPTNVLETGYEILFFWVARMILMSEYHLDTIPFKTIYLHGTVRDSKGQKMSKSLGNGIDPLDIAQKYGSDAGRMALIFGTAPGTDSKISEDKIKGQKLFANKLWNITRFVMSNFDVNSLNSDYSERDNELQTEWKKHLKLITDDIENFALHRASENIYSYIWTRFADQIIEESKPLLLNEDVKIKESRQKLLYTILTESIAALHPFMPFVTESIWQLLPSKERPLLMISSWPKY
jgi:valyl-tRNA synthetase